MDKNDCPLCGGHLKEGRVPYAFAGIPFGTFQADACQKCGEPFFTQEAWEEIERIAKQKGLWGIGRRVKVGHSGHSLIVRIPAQLAQLARLKSGTTVTIQPAGRGQLLLERD